MERTVTLEQSLAILVPAAWSNDQQGGFLENLAGTILRRQSYEVTTRVRFTGMEVDLLAKHKPSGDEVYVECKFHNRSISANVIDLMIGQAFRRRLVRLALFSVGNLGKDANGAVDDLKRDHRLSFSVYGPDALLEALIDSGAAPRLPQSGIAPSVSHATLLVHPECAYVWLLQDQKDGRPYRIIPYAPPGSHRQLPINLRALLDEHEMLEGLPISDYWTPETRAKSDEKRASAPAEVVGRVITADTILDYRPCRPEDFVGRHRLQKEIWEFLDSVRENKTATRLIAVVGASGYGKSSLVAKLAERFRNKKWKNQYFLFPVDVRSARGPLFVAEALLQALRSAAEASFLELPKKLAVTDADNVLSSDSVRSVLSTLKRENKVLVVFFDQFEEVFTKDELLPVFRVFRRFALDVQAKRSNLVIGFSWRTGISLSNDNPAYQLWNELRDHRITKQLEPFDIAESSGLVSQFEEQLHEKLLSPLRRKIQEQGQGLPWFLKKLCIHIHGQISRGVSQVDLLGSRLNVQALFDEDLEPLSDAQLSCIRYIAANSPVDSLEVFERYGNETVTSLSEKRLIVRAGQRFAVYWDIFRDYLNEEKVPAIPWTYIPNCTIGVAMSTCQMLARRGAMSTTELALDMSYSEGTTVNIITDLQNMALCGKNSDGLHVLLDGVTMASVPGRVRSQFAEHVLFKRLQEYAGDAGKLVKTKAVEIVRILYAGSDVKPSTRDNYLGRLLSWLEFGGLVKTDATSIYVYSPVKHGKIGPNFGKLPTRNKSSGKAMFRACAPPEVTEKLLIRLMQGKVVKRAEIANGKLRNSAVDLTALGLARWSDAGLVGANPTPGIAPSGVLARAARQSMTMVMFETIVVAPRGMSRGDVGRLLSEKLGRAWKDSSAVRYANGLYRYREYIADTDTPV